LTWFDCVLIRFSLKYQLTPTNDAEREREEVSRDFVGWNQIARWLKRIDGFRACS
jgi:hypothetical protein